MRINWQLVPKRYPSLWTFDDGAFVTSGPGGVFPKERAKSPSVPVSEAEDEEETSCFDCGKRIRVARRAGRLIWLELDSPRWHQCPKPRNRSHTHNYEIFEERHG